MRHKPVEAVAATCPILLDDLHKQVDIVGFTDDDAQLQEMAQAAFDHLHGVNGILNRALVSGQWSQKFDDFSDLRLAIGPVTSIVSISYLDPDGVTQTVPSANYNLFEGYGYWSVVKSPSTIWPTPMDISGAITVTFQSGHLSIPKPLRSAILKHVSSLYKDREEDAIGSKSYRRLVSPWKLTGL